MTFDCYFLIFCLGLKIRSRIWHLTVIFLFFCLLGDEQNVWYPPTSSAITCNEAMKTRKASCHHWSINPATPVEASSNNFACGSRSVFVFVMVLLAPSWLFLAQVWWLQIGWMVMVSSKKEWSTRKNNWKLEEQKVTFYEQTRKKYPTRRPTKQSFWDDPWGKGFAWSLGQSLVQMDYSWARWKPTTQ